jgi:hypothetical protein
MSWFGSTPWPLNVVVSGLSVVYVDSGGGRWCWKRR